MDNYTLSGFAGYSENYSVGQFDSTQVTQQNLKLIELYVGYNITGTTYSNISNNLYLNFFEL
jgi:hypothetical protein